MFRLPRSPFLCSFLLVLNLLSLPFITACGGPPDREKLVKIAGYGQQLKAQLAINRSLPESLFIQGVITAERRTFLNEKFVRAELLVNSFNDAMTFVLAQQKPNAGHLVSLVADMITEVQLISADAKPQFKKALAIIEISLRAIASYFATQIEMARKSIGRRALAQYIDFADVEVIDRYVREQDRKAEGFGR